MAKAGLFALFSAILGFMASTQVASAETLVDQAGPTVTSIVVVGWLGMLALLFVAIVLPRLRRE